MQLEATPLTAMQHARRLHCFARYHDESPMMAPSPHHINLGLGHGIYIMHAQNPDASLSTVHCHRSSSPRFEALSGVLTVLARLSQHDLPHSARITCFCQKGRREWASNCGSCADCRRVRHMFLYMSHCDLIVSWSRNNG